MVVSCSEIFFPRSHPPQREGPTLPVPPEPHRNAPIRKIWKLVETGVGGARCDSQPRLGGNISEITQAQSPGVCIPRPEMAALHFATLDPLP